MTAASGNATLFYRNITVKALPKSVQGARCGI
jgi:hypothetical protein